jgi:beta-N-acetylhexosaminidase
MCMSRPAGRQRGRRRGLKTLLLVLAVASLVAGAYWLPWYISAPSGVVRPMSSAAAKTALECTARMPVEVLAGQVLAIGLPANQMAAQAAMFKQFHIGGAVLMSSPANPNDGSIGQFKSAGGAAGWPLMISTDEEGGLVQRFTTLGVLPAPATVAVNDSTSQARALIASHGSKLKGVGVDMVLGPVADVSPDTGTGPLGDRAFSRDPGVVSSYARAYVQGWQDAGLLPVLKHFPGLGSATGNTDFVPATAPPLSTLVARDFIPYRALSGTGTGVMVGNQTVPGWFSGPASLSPTAVAYLRETLGYGDALVVTDSLDAKAVSSTTSFSAAAVQAIAAGSDIAIIVGSDPRGLTPQLNQAFISQAVTALVQAVQNGTLSKGRLVDAVARKLAAQRLAPCSLPRSGA